MKRRAFLALLGGAAAWPLRARAQQPGKTFTIGFLSPVPLTLPTHAAFPDALRELGWIEGYNIVIERRHGDNQPDRLEQAAAELVRLNVDVIVASGTLAPMAARRVTTTIPIVMTAAGDPVGSGLIASLARPAGNLTGMSLMAPDLGGKRLELLREIVPRLSRIGILWNSVNPYPALVFNQTRESAQALGIEVQSLEVRGREDFAAAFAAARSHQPDALIVVDDPLTSYERKSVAEFAARHRLPALSGVREYVTAGGLMSYGASLADLFRRAAGYVDKILRGAKPADLPVQQPTTFELVINLKAAKALGLEVPPTLLARADEVIE